VIYVRFLRNVLIVWMLMLVLCSGALIYGRASNQPNELQELGFGTCDGDPCFMGIVPGKTSWEDADILLKRFNPSIQQEGWAEYDERHLHVILREAKNYVDMLDLSPIEYSHSFGITLQMLIQNMGVPCAVSYSTRGSIGPALYYPSFWVVVISNQDRIRPLDAIEEIYVAHSEESIGCKQTRASPRKPWLGFTLLSRYTTVE
jgi:hypothetical protein